MMQFSRLSFVSGFFVILLFLSGAAFAADVIVLKSGRTITGKILTRSDKTLEVEMTVGKSTATITIQVSDIDRIEKGENKDVEFRKRWSALKSNDLPGHEALLKWCRVKLQNNIFDAFFNCFFYFVRTWNKTKSTLPRFRIHKRNGHA